MPATPPSNANNPQPKLGEPFCSKCGHQLTGLVDSSKCPECGRPIVEVLTRRSARGKRYRSETTLFGLPLVEIAYGPTDTETIGKAKAIIALGDKAKGFIAVGGTATGIVAVGGRAVGLFAFGGLSLALIGGWGGMCVGLLASGGLALGGFTFGGASAGFGASGGISAGYYSSGGAPFGAYSLGPGKNDPEAVSFFSSMDWFFGPPSFNLWNFVQPLIVIVGLAAITTIGIALMAILAHMRAARRGLSIR